MTKIILSDTGESIHVKVKGHNEDSKVCASISTLVLTFSQMILDSNIKSRMDLETGNADISVRKDDLGMYALDMIHALNFLRTGFRMLADSYPDKVKVVHRE